MINDLWHIAVPNRIAKEYHIIAVPIVYGVGNFRSGILLRFPAGYSKHFVIVRGIWGNRANLKQIGSGLLGNHLRYDGGIALFHDTDIVILASAGEVGYKRLASCPVIRLLRLACGQIIAENGRYLRASRMIFRCETVSVHSIDDSIRSGPIHGIHRIS